MKLSEKAKNLLSDTFAFALSGATVKALAFFMVPLYTAFLSTDDYAVADLVSLSIQLAIPLLTCSISDSVLRFGIEGKEGRNVIVGTGFVVALIGIALTIPICCMLFVLTKDSWLALSSFFLFTLQNLNSYYAAYFKCIDRTKTMAVVSFVSGTSVIILNCIFIAGLGLGLHGYWLGNIIGNCVGLVIYTCLGGWRAFGYVKHYDKTELRVLLGYSIPLVPNSLFWWINSSLDRFVLMALSTLSFVGLYSVALKIPQIMSTVSGFFFQAWNISVFKDFGSEEAALFFKRGFQFVSTGTYFIAGGLIVAVIPLASFLFQGDFFEAWSLVPLLTVGAFVSTLNQFLGSAFTAAKDTKVIFVTTALGSVTNIVLNIVLVITIGGFGAVIATLLSYIIVFVARKVIINKNYPMLRSNSMLQFYQIVCLITLSALAMSELEMALLIGAYLLTIIAMIPVLIKDRHGAS